MLIWTGVWLATVTLEALAYTTITRKAAANSVARRFVFGLVAVIVIISAILLTMQEWKLWLLPCLFIPYQLINIARAVRYRLQPDHLRTASLQTLFWLVLAQLIALALSWLVLRKELISIVPVVIASLQALIAVVLLGSMTRTWEHIKPNLEATPRSDSELPSLSVLVPARNETIDLQNCLEHLVASDYPKLEIIALDDNSADRRTPEIIRGFAHQGVRFVEGDEPPKHWLAKNHAYNRLLEESSGELVMFCGVDVLVQPQTLRRLVEVLLTENRDMISVLPLRPENEHRKLSFIQAMRYWWELGWPRRAFNRPPVLSTLWLMRSEVLKRAGGFKATIRMITPEAFFARQTIKNDRYLFIRSTRDLPIYSTKTVAQQYATGLRIRYPQLHRRIALVALVALFEAFFLIGPYLFLILSFVNGYGATSILLAIVAIAALSRMYFIVGVRTHLNNLWLGLLTAPIAFLLDIFMLHNSMFKYEFDKVIWHDRSVSQPMLEAIPKLPELS